jgi:predicted DNA-binding transcriptional regulator AlpA
MGVGIMSDAPRLPGWPAAMGAPLAAAYVDLSESTLHTLLANGRFPEPISLSDRRRGWRRTDLDQWVEQGGAGGAGGATGNKNPWD